jgi:nucleoside-diphosphate-sugar epimerase
VPAPTGLGSANEAFPKRLVVMKVLVIGGTGLTGPYVVQHLVRSGHDVTVFHRGVTAAHLPSSVQIIHGDKSRLEDHRRQFERLAPEVVIHMNAVTRTDALAFVSTMEAIVRRAVVVSSIDVYLAYGRIHGIEPGPIQRVPLTEDSQLRTGLGPEGAAYDKTGVEELTCAAPFPTTIVRYPAVYGPNDSQHRFYRNLKPMLDRRPAIVLGEAEASFRMSHGYSEDVAQAVALGAMSEETAGHVFNVAELETPTLQERTRHLANVFGWDGEIVVVPDAEVPTKRVRAVNLLQDWVVDTSRVRRALGYEEIIPYEEGLQRTISWLLANPPAPESTTPDYAAEDRLLARLRGYPG